MNDQSHKNAPLQRPPSLANQEKSPEYQDNLRRKGEAELKEAPWRATLDQMSRDELVELAVSAAYNSEHLWKRIQRLRDKNVKNRRDRQKGSRVKLANDPTQKVKPEVKDLWQHHLDCKPGYRYQTGAAFDRKMQEKFSAAIKDPGTIEGWRREWAKEMPSTVETGEGCENPHVLLMNPWTPETAEAIQDPLPEIFWLLGYYKLKQNL